MKIRTGFVSNSSSSSFIITNTSSKTKTLVDFVKENPQLIEEFKYQYDLYKDNERYTQENLLESAKHRKIEWMPGEKMQIAFGDEEGDLIGHVFDYILRDGGRSKSFVWQFHEYLR